MTRKVAIELGRVLAAALVAGGLVYGSIYLGWLPAVPATHATTTTATVEASPLPPEPTTTTAPTTTTTTTAVTVVPVTFTVAVINESYGSPLTQRQCSAATGRSGNFDDIPSATYALTNAQGDVISVLFPEADAPDDRCVFTFSGEVEGGLPERMTLRGPRMQQNGFPIRSEDISTIEGGAFLLAELSISVNTDRL